MPTYDIFWTFVANFAEKVRTVEAKSIRDAIERGTPYSPYKRSDGCGYRMRFIVWEHGVGLVHDGTVEDLKDFEVIDKAVKAIAKRIVRDNQITADSKKAFFEDRKFSLEVDDIVRVEIKKGNLPNDGSVSAYADAVLDEIDGMFSNKNK